MNRHHSRPQLTDMAENCLTFLAGHNKYELVQPGLEWHLSKYGWIEGPFESVLDDKVGMV